LIGRDRAEVRRVADAIAALPPAGPVRPRDDVLRFLQTTNPSEQTALPTSYEERVLVGTPAEVVDRLRAYQGLGVTHFLLWFLDFPSTGGLDLFAEKVLPAMRERG